MGDRALVIFKDKETVSPVVYLHWSGERVPAMLEEHKALMSERTGDAEYAVARFVGIAHAATPGALSLGLWNCPPNIEAAVLAGDADVLVNYSHGDAGVIVIDVNSYDWQAYGGYLPARNAA